MVRIMPALSFTRENVANLLDSLQHWVFGLYVLSLPLSISGMEIFSSLLVVLLLVRWWLTRDRLETPPFAKPLALFMGVAALSALFGLKPSFSEKLADVASLRFFALYFFLYYQLRLYTRSRYWLWILFVATLVVGVYGVFQHFTPLDLIRPHGKKIIHYAVEELSLGPRVLGTFDWHLSFANVYLLYASAFLSLALSMFPRQWWRLLHASLLCVVVVWTSSRIAWFATSVTVVLCACTRGWRALAVAVGLVVLVLLGSFATSAGMRERLRRTVEGTNPGYNFSQRQCVWEIHRDIFLDHPVLGIGFHNNGFLSDKYVEGSCIGYVERAVGNAHSTPLEILASTGILGALAYVWFWFSVFLWGLRRYLILEPATKDRAFGWGCLVALLGFNLQGVSHLNIYEPIIAHNLAFFLALLANMGNLGLSPRSIE
ncbi:MAG: O-antigen ligase family protein [Bdellovibrionales bacterium]|nr:O-antigen ligase family protein [Bdellovibrionales bacterium]